MGSVLSWMRPRRDSSSASRGSKPSHVITLQSIEQWNNLLEASKKSTQPMVIDFSASWCGPCNFMAPIFEDFAAKFTDVKFVKIDLDKFRGLAQEFGVSAVPTFLLMKQGKRVDEVLGAKADELKNMIEKHRGGGLGVEDESGQLQEW